VVSGAVHVTDQETGILGIDKTYLIPHLIKAIQELSAKVAALEARLP